MSRKPVMRVDPVEIPYQCVTCWYYSAQTEEHGSCYAVPPQVLVDNDGDWACPRPIVLAEDIGCTLWKPRHVA